MRKSSRSSSSDQEKFEVRSGKDSEEELTRRDKVVKVRGCVKLWRTTKLQKRPGSEKGQAKHSSASSSQYGSDSDPELIGQQKLTSAGFTEQGPVGLRYVQPSTIFESFMKQLNLSGSCLSDLAAFDISRNQAHLEMFIFNDNHMGNEGGIALAKGLCNLTYLDLSNNQLDEAGIWEIARYLPLSARTLIIDARVTQEGTRTLSQWFKNRIKQLCPNLTITSNF